MARKWSKTYDRKTRTYTYANTLSDDESFIVFRAGFGGGIEWTASSPLYGDAQGYSSLYAAVCDFMGWEDFKEWMSDRMVA